MSNESGPPRPADSIQIDLARQLAESELVALAEAFGGSRLYIPATMTAEHRIAKAIGLPAAERLASHAGALSVRVPLARALRARVYRSRGDSMAEIARRLGLTENGVSRMLARLERNATDGP